MSLCLLLDELLMSWNSTRGDNSPETAQRRMKARAAVEAYVSAAEKERDEAKAEVERLRNLAKQSFDLEMDSLARSRDEALAWGEKLKEALEGPPCNCFAGCDICESWITREQALSTPAPAALSHLRQEIRREALEEAAKECDERARIESAKAQQCRDRKEIAWAQMYDQNADQARLMAQDLRRLAEEQEGKNERV